MPEFVPGLKLSRLFFQQAVRSILESTTPELKYAAALIGSGSEVLGFDDEMSADHHWGPRVMIFLNDVDQHEVLDAALRGHLPTTFLGYPTNFSDPDPTDNNVQLLNPVEGPPINHRVDIFTIREYLQSYLGFDIEKVIEPADWLSFPEQKLRSITAGEVFHDEIGLQDVLQRFKYYPRDVWLYLLASGWNRIGQEEHLMGRAGQAGDEIGSALIGARLVRDIMRLCFLMERTYAPYPKWFGTAFRQLACAAKIEPQVQAILDSRTWQERESNLIPAYEAIAAMHNALGITEALPARAATFFGRPFKVINLPGDFSEKIRAQIKDVHVKKIAERKLIGSLDQFSDSTDVLSDAKLRGKLLGLYG